MKQQPNPSETRPIAKGKDSWVGQQCIIKKGGWKGFEGIVKDADDKTVRVELSAKAKVLTLPREMVFLKNEAFEQNENDKISKLDQGFYFFW